MDIVEKPSLFIWRFKYCEEDTSWDFPAFDNCIYCKFPLTKGGCSKRDESDCVITTSIKSCSNCGWNYDIYIGQAGIGSRGMVSTNYAGLVELSIDDPALALDELGSHLKKNFADIYSITPRKFEELITNVFKHFDYHPVLTPQTKDGGIDIYLFQRGDDDFAVVECKRYASNRKVGVFAVDRLLGASLVKGSKSAYLVTTSSFTKDALNHAYSPRLKESGIKLDLIDAGELLKMLGVYNTTLPPLDVEWKTRADKLSNYFERG